MDEKIPEGEIRVGQLCNVRDDLYGVDAKGCVWRQDFRGTEWVWVRVSMKIDNPAESKKASSANRA